MNTSFNIRGNPILTTIEDALNVLCNTELDYLIVEDWLFEKKQPNDFKNGKFFYLLNIVAANQNNNLG